MKLLLLALLPLAFARDIPTIVFPEDANRNFFVIGGSEVDPVGKYPWQVSNGACLENTWHLTRYSLGVTDIISDLSLSL